MQMSPFFAAAAVVLLAAAAPRPALAGALDLAVGEKVQALAGVQILNVAAGEVVYQLFSELDAGKHIVHRLPLAQVLRLKEHDAATFTHAEWHRTELRNFRMAEDGYRQAIREATAGRAPKWSLPAAYARLIEMHLAQQRITDALEAYAELADATRTDSPEKFLPASITTDDARAYDRGVRAIHAVLAQAAKAGRPLAAYSAFADRLEFHGPAVLREKGFLGIDEPATERIIFVAARGGPAEDPTVRSAIAAAIRSLQPGREFAVFFGPERSAAAERRVALNGQTVKSDHSPGRLTSVRADPRIIFDPLPKPQQPAADVGPGLEAALRMTGTADTAAAADAVFLVVDGSADPAAIEKALAAGARTADGKPATRVHILRVPAGSMSADPDGLDDRLKALAQGRGGRYRRFEPAEWARISTCR